MEKTQFESISFELKNLTVKIETYLNSNDYVYPKTYGTWIQRYNTIIRKYNKLKSSSLDILTCDNFDLSSTGKTVKKSSIDYLTRTISNTIEKTKSDIAEIESEKVNSVIPLHQMRSCFKIGKSGCPLNPPLQNSKVFIAMPFSEEYQDSFDFGIVPALNSVGLSYYRADKEISSKDIMCKICEQIQSCKFAIVNISGLNANVMLELGLLYGLGKPVIIIKNTATKTISDLGSIEYIEYTHAKDLANKLNSALS